MNKSSAYLIALILSLSIVFAVDYDINITPIRDKITLEQSAQFTISTISNSGKIERFNVFSPDVKWSIPPQTIRAYPTAKEEYDLVITPSKYVIPGPYGITVSFRRENPEELIEKTVFVTVKPGAEIISRYRPSLKTNVDMPSSASPDKRLTIRVNVDNQNVLNLTDLQIRISSDLTALNTERTIQLAPLEEKILDFTYELNPLQAPGEYRVSFELLKGNESIDIFATQLLNILESKVTFEKQENEKLNFLKLQKELTYTSKSNVNSTQKITLPIGFFEQWFSSSDPDGKVFKEEGNRFIGWDLSLMPGESKTIYLTINYRPVLYIIILIIIFLSLYYYFKSPVDIRKEVSEVSLKEGGISHIKVMIEIRNSSKKSISPILTVDYVPKIAVLEQNFIEGTIKPSKMLHHPEKGTILKWELAELAPGEDRLISYNIKSKLSILGNFRLPRAKVKFKHNGREYTSYSNTLEISS